ncbi:MAG: flagellin [Verrucomicrobiota bacterium]
MSEISISSSRSAADVLRHLGESSDALSQSLARLSSGSRLVAPETDVGGLAVSMRTEAKLRRLDAALSNLNGVITFTQTQDTYLSKVAAALNRMSELATLALDSTKTNPDRSLYDTEFTSLAEFVTSVTSKEINGVSLFSSARPSVFYDSEGNYFLMNAISMASSVFSSLGAASISTTTSANTALANVKELLLQVGRNRVDALRYLKLMHMFRDTHAQNKEALLAANSRIRDVDMANESTHLARSRILTQSSMAMLAQANVTQEVALRLMS